jgi:hypothetical protein
VSKLDHMLEPEVTAVLRLQVISGTGGGVSSLRTSRRGLLKRRLFLGRSFWRWLCTPILRNLISATTAALSLVITMPSVLLRLFGAVRVSTSGGPSSTRRCAA